MNKTWKPIVAGILEILAGFVMLASTLVFITLLVLEAPLPWEVLTLSVGAVIQFIFGLLSWLIAFVAVLLGIVSLVGGVCALLRRRWRLAFWGAIATVPLLFFAPVGVGAWVNFEYGIAMHYFIWSPLLLVIAIITLIVLSKREFK